MLLYIYYNQRWWVIPFIAWNVSTIRLLYFPQVTAFDLCLLFTYEQFSSGHSWLQNSSTRLIKSCGLALRTSNLTKLRTCCCGFQDLRSCGLAVADFKNYEVANLRLRIQESWNVVADLRLRIKKTENRLRTADLKKNLRCPALYCYVSHSDFIIVVVPTQHSFKARRNILEMTSWWWHCVRFDQIQYTV